MGWPFFDSPFGYSCSVNAVQPPLPFVCFESQLAKRWYMRKGGRVKPDKDANEQQHPSQVTSLQFIKKTNRNAENSMVKTARKSCKQISFFKVASHSWAAFLVLVKHASYVLNVDFRCICWVGRSSEESNVGAMASAEVTVA